MKLTCIFLPLNLEQFDFAHPQDIAQILRTPGSRVGVNVLCNLRMHSCIFLAGGFTVPHILGATSLVSFFPADSHSALPAGTHL